MLQRVYAERSTRKNQKTINRKVPKGRKMEIINYDTLFEKYAGIGFEKQFSLADIIGDRPWNLDIEKGIISFGDDIAMPVQILGTYSHQANTWMWAWANTSLGIPDSLLREANELKKLGENHNVEFLIKEEYKIEPTDVHALGIIASGMFESSAYYAGDFGDGIVLLTLKDELIDKIEYDEITRMTTTFPQIISTFGINHRRTFINYAKAKGFEIIEEDNNILARKGQKEVAAIFDEQNRLINLKSEISK